MSGTNGDVDQALTNVSSAQLEEEKLKQVIQQIGNIKNEMKEKEKEYNQAKSSFTYKATKLADEYKELKRQLADFETTVKELDISASTKTYIGATRVLTNSTTPGYYYNNPNINNNTIPAAYSPSYNNTSINPAPVYSYSPYASASPSSNGMMVNVPFNGSSYYNTISPQTLAYVGGGSEESILSLNKIHQSKTKPKQRIQWDQP